MAKKREPDNLAKNAAAAKAAGMSYGKWKALHPHTKDDAYIPEVKINTKPCENCGKPIQTTRRQGARRYCSEECAYIARCIQKNAWVKKQREQNGECV